MAKIEPQPGIMNIALYQGGSSHIPGVENVIKLSSNENPFGPSPAAIEAVRKSAADMHRYPSTNHDSLRAAIAEMCDLESDRICCGVGSGELLKLLADAYAGPGDEILFTEHGFSMYPIYADACGATPVQVPEHDRVTDVDALLAGCTPRTKLVYVANPNNPTSTMIGTAELARLADGLPEGAILVLDGAYAEYVEGYDGGAALVRARDNVVMTRTFSKLYGLGGMRVGWCYGPQAIIDVLNRIRGPFNLSAPALAAAEAAIRDTAYVERCRSENARWRVWLAESLAEIGIPSDISCANFILARFSSEAEANGCDEHLKSEGIIVRRVAGYNLPEALRITVGDEIACRRIVAAVRAFKEGRG